MESSFTLRPSGEPIPAIVIDCGSCLSRIGFSTDPHPKAVEPTIVASEKHTGDETFPKEKRNTKTICGKDAVTPPENFRRKFPIEYGCITSFEVMEHFWHYLFYDKLKVKPEEFPMTIVEEPMLPRCTREKTAQIMFEEFDVPALSLIKSPEAQLMAQGNRKTGLVLDLGGGSFKVTPVLEGYVLRQFVPKADQCGRELTSHLLMLLNKNDNMEYSSKSIQTAKQIKEQMCYVALDFEQEQATFSCQQERQVITPDGSSIRVGRERFLCPELIFKPQLQGREMLGLHDIVYSCCFNRIQDRDLNNDIFSNIVLCGGSALFPGLASRLETELQTLIGPSKKVQVMVATDQHSAFRGATMLARQEDFSHRMLTKDFYDEYGPCGVERFCL